MSRKTRRPGKRGQAGQARRKGRTRRPADSDILILSDGRVMAHNLTQGMAAVLHKLNPGDKAIRARADRKQAQPDNARAARPKRPPTS
jgi:hypothetical protein